MKRDRDAGSASKDPHGVKSWAAYKVSGSTAIAYGGVILASTKVEAEDEAYAAFKAYTPREKALVYVREADLNEPKPHPRTSAPKEQILPRQ